MEDVAQTKGATAIVIAVPSATGPELSELVDVAIRAKLDVRVLPSVRELLGGEVRVVDIREPVERDLLGRHRIETDLEAIANYLKGRRVAVTGAGGSVRTKVCGPLAVLEASAACGVECFVNVSTDKAANPCSVLGYSKRIAEGLTAWVDGRVSARYMSVRFGNVLGSRGSVLTAFRKQLESGGPLTVTHRDAQRYFMT